MKGNSSRTHKAQLDKNEREHLEDVVEDMRERVENNVEYQLSRKGLDSEPSDRDELGEDDRELYEAIEIEGVDGADWEEAFDQYVTGVGYTIVNRLTALRCMEVRDFIDEEVTVVKENGLTPAAETLVNEEFLTEDEALLTAYHNACDDLAEDIEILFDRSSSYSLVDPDDDAMTDLCEMLDGIKDEVWRADDVLGWVYEYYNRPVVEALDAKNKLEPEDVGPANQFYTPHWVVRMLTDNSLGKLYLEATDKESTVPDPEELSPEERKNRLVTPEDSPSVPELCTYLIPDDEEHDAPDFDHPSELRVIDPACGSGHFLLYAFDVLERIWWQETEHDRDQIPGKVLEHNLYGVDIDLRSCQLSAFNLYLKARGRAEEEGNEEFDMPQVGIVCADARVAEVEEAIEVLDEITGEGTEVRAALDDIIEEFQTTEALGSLLDVHGTLSEEFMKQQTDIMEWEGEGPKTLNHFLKELRNAVEERTSDSFDEQNLRSFLNLLVVLTQEYDVALMNPPYGSGGRMPDDVQEYVEDNYGYTDEYYINFFEACDRLLVDGGRVGMLVPHSFMFNDSFQEFREDLIGGRASFDFFSEFGYGVLDNATVGTVGTVIRKGSTTNSFGTFIRLADINKEKKESVFLHTSFIHEKYGGIKRKYVRNLSEFNHIPGKNISYWVDKELRRLYCSNTILDAEKGGMEKQTMGSVRVGLQTGNNGRFVRAFWEHQRPERWKPFAKGGADAWMLSRMKLSVLWGEKGREVRRYKKSYPRNMDHHFNESLTYTVAKRSGRRFSYLHDSSVFGTKGSVFLPERATWEALSYTNSHLFTYLMIAQTAERNWKRRQVARIPWTEKLEMSDELERVSRKAVGNVITKRQHDFISPHYNGPILLFILGEQETLSPHADHPHRELRDELELAEPEETVSKSDSLEDAGKVAARHLERIDKNLQDCADDIDEEVFDCFDITDEQRETILQEIALRTIEDPREREEYDPEAIDEPSEDFPEMVKDLLLHLTLRVVHEDDDGIVAISDVERETNLLERIEDEFERIWGDHAQARLAEVDEVLGSKTADEEAYPNLRDWLENNLFEYHVSKFDNTPILWRLTTERLVSDPEGEGFACLVDYHQLDSGVFDRLQNRYLEPRKNLLRERRSAANRRRSDSSLSASEQAEAAEEYDRCESGLEQIEIFEDQMAELAQDNPRDWPAEHQDTAAEAIDKIQRFREETQAKLDSLESLREADEFVMEDEFSPSFYETVEENQAEWIDALEDLESAFEAYSADSTEPVEAHLYDLFEYYDDLAGSTHYSSNGILFMTYYFNKLEEPEQAKLSDGGGTEIQQHISNLASGLDEFTELGEEIGEHCDQLSSEIPSEWHTRALSEITTKGYQPNHKHGVAVNITPLSEAEVVPEIVEEKVI